MSITTIWDKKSKIYIAYLKGFPQKNLKSEFLTFLFQLEVREEAA